MDPGSNPLFETHPDHDSTAMPIEMVSQMVDIHGSMVFWTPRNNAIPYHEGLQIVMIPMNHVWNGPYPYESRMGSLRSL